jgi:acyl dehydratase
MTLAGYSLATAAQFVGRELGVSDWVVVDQDRIGAFAECTGDRQWIHVDVERAKRESPFGGPIAHGYLTLSLVAATVMEIGIVPPDAATGLNYGVDKVRFIAPVKAGARVRNRATLVAAEPSAEWRAHASQATMHGGDRGRAEARLDRGDPLHADRSKPCLKPVTMTFANRPRRTRLPPTPWSASEARTWLMRCACCSAR